MRRALALALAGGLVIAGIASAAPTLGDVETFLRGQLAQQRTVEAEWATRRERIDDYIRANTRTLFRAELIPLRNLVSSRKEKAAVTAVLNALAAPGPADSASKRIHTKIRRQGSWVIRTMRRQIRQTEDFLAEWP